MTPKEIAQRKNRFVFYICLLILACAGHFWSGYQCGKFAAQREWEERIKGRKALVDSNPTAATKLVQD